jgi:uncharacterized protein
MKFYNREEELALLCSIFEQSKQQGKMSVLTGRRRVGKTLLAREFIKDRTHIYLFVTKKSENLLCEEFLQEIKQVVGHESVIIGEIKTVKEIFLLLLRITKQTPLTVVIDEFQEFLQINPAVFSEIQNLWDQYKVESRLNLIFIGSVYSLINKIFRDQKEPLFGRADRILHLNAFNIKTLSTILQDQQLKKSALLFDWYCLTGGMPKYVELFVYQKIKTFDDCLDFMLDKFSPFLNEGKYLLIEEFGKDYITYFSILELISSGKTARQEIESVLAKNVGGYLHRLDSDYAVIQQCKPIDAKPHSRLLKYEIIDNFINFWFRYFYRHRSAIEIENFDYVKHIIKEDYTTYAGKILERFYHDLFSQSGKYNKIGRYWEKGNENEIDLVAINDYEKKIVIADIKWQHKKLNLQKLAIKAKKLIENYSKYHIEYVGLSLETVENFW